MFELLVISFIIMFTFSGIDNSTNLSLRDKQNTYELQKNNL